MNLKLGKLIILALLLFFIQQFSYGQQQFFVIDSINQEPLIGATISINKDQKTNYLQTDEFGYFNTKIATPFEVSISYVGYENKKLQISKPVAERMAIMMVNNTTLKTVVVREEKVREIESDILHIPVSKLDKLPVIGGEKDIMKSITLLPGIQQGVEGSSSISVRGGNLDENLILLDDIPIYNAAHYFGFLSIFNSNTIKDVKIYKGGFPARYGGRLSSVIDLKMKEGSEKSSKNLTLGLLNTGFTYTGKINKKTTAMASFRGSPYGLLLYPFRATFNNENSTGFTSFIIYDAYAKITHKKDANNIFQWSFYNGMDDIDQFFRGEDKATTKNGVKWGNIATRLKYKKILDNGNNWSNSISYNKYFYKNKNVLKEDDTETEQFVRNGINEVNANSIFTFNQLNNSTFYAGANFKIQTIPFKTEGNFDELSNQTETYNNKEANVFIENKSFLLDGKIKINSGIRLSNYWVNDASFHSLEPRFSLNYKVNDKLSFGLGYAKTSQNLVLLKSFFNYFPNDVWFPISKKTGLPTNHQFNVSTAFEFGEGHQINIGAYIKKGTNSIRFNTERTFFHVSQNDFSSLVNSGGKSDIKGLEVSYSFKFKKLEGLLSYEYLDSKRQFDDVNNGKPFNFKFGRKHNFKMFANYQINDKKAINFNVVWSSGIYFNVPDEIQLSTLGQFVPVNRQINNFKTPNYFRLDLGYSWKTVSKKGRDREWNISVYNTTAHNNPFYAHYFNGKAQVISNLNFFPGISMSQKW